MGGIRSELADGRHRGTATTFGELLDKVGQTEADTAELFLNDVRVQAENVIGDVGAAFGYLMERLGQELCRGRHRRR